VFGLPTLASLNHQFDAQTPGVNNDAAKGAAFGPPAPPRDGLSSAATGNLPDTFNFAQNPAYTPTLPRVAVTEPLTEARKAQILSAVLR